LRTRDKLTVPALQAAAANDMQAPLESFVVAESRAGRSLREIAELVDRSQTAARRRAGAIDTSRHTNQEIGHVVVTWTLLAPATSY
jgi:hypothetical protein